MHGGRGARVVQAEASDFSAWLRLAAEVEPLFGPLVGEPSFEGALRRNIGRGTAFCVREGDGSPGAALCGGLLFSPRPPVYSIGWLAVARVHRGQGIGRQLVARALSTASAPAEVVVTTFGPGVEAGIPARRFYEGLGFQAAEMAPDGPEGGARQVLRRVLR